MLEVARSVDHRQGNGRSRNPGAAMWSSPMAQRRRPAQTAQSASRGDLFWRWARNLRARGAAWWPSPDLSRRTPTGRLRTGDDWNGTWIIVPSESNPSRPTSWKVDFADLGAADRARGVRGRPRVLPHPVEADAPLGFSRRNQERRGAAQHSTASGSRPRQPNQRKHVIVPSRTVPVRACKCIA
jgi:hypothetical protein